MIKMTNYKGQTYLVKKPVNSQTSTLALPGVYIYVVNK